MTPSVTDEQARRAVNAVDRELPDTHYAILIFVPLVGATTPHEVKLTTNQDVKPYHIAKSLLSASSKLLDVMQEQSPT